MHLPTALLVAWTLAADPALDMPLCAPPSPLRAQQAVEGALAYMTHEGTKWVQERQCAACHHTPWLLTASREARRAGYRFDEAAVAAASEFTFASANLTKLLRDPDKPDDTNLNLAVVYITLARGDEVITDPASRDVLAQLVGQAISKQQADGSWVDPTGRPPLFDSQEATTLLAWLALSSPILRDMPDQPALEAARQKALAWLDATPDEDSQQSDALRLISLVRRQRPPEELSPAVERVLAWQTPDGGFAQARDRASDALATGQSLFALLEAGASRDDPVVLRGVAFLVNTQRADGSWAILSRPATPGGNGANVLGPITYTATGWAAIGLSRAAPR